VDDNIGKAGCLVLMVVLLLVVVILMLGQRGRAGASDRVVPITDSTRIVR